MSSRLLISTLVLIASSLFIFQNCQKPFFANSEGQVLDLKSKVTYGLSDQELEQKIQDNKNIAAHDPEIQLFRSASNDTYIGRPIAEWEEAGYLLIGGLNRFMLDIENHSYGV